jgi:hypothetical protein
MTEQAARKHAHMSRQKNCKHKHIEGGGGERGKESNVSMDCKRDAFFLSFLFVSKDFPFLKIEMDFSL